MSVSESGTFPQECRLKKYREFQVVFQNGRFFYNEFIKIGALKNDRKVSRLGLVISKKHGSAPHRNRIKRLLREAFRKNKNKIEIPSDILIVPSLKFKEWSLEVCQRAFDQLVRKYNASLGGRKIN